MTDETASRTPPAAIARARDLVQPALRAAVDGLDDRMRLIAEYQLGWVDPDGTPSAAGSGKAIRPTLAIVSAEAGGGRPQDGLPSAVAVELVHNFSLLHDDVMDRDLERRHRPTAWTVFGDGQAILAGNALLTAAIEALVSSPEGGVRSLPSLLHATQRLISGQSDDLAFEGSPVVDVQRCLAMEAGKTAALLACSASIGALAAGAAQPVVTALAGFGEELGMAFQLVDDILGITGDPELTGKSSSSDVRSGKRSAPVVAALCAGTQASKRLAELLADGPPANEDDVVLATKLIDEAGGLDWASGEADRRLADALAHLDSVPLPNGPRGDFVALARYVVHRDH